MALLVAVLLGAPTSVRAQKPDTTAAADTLVYVLAPLQVSVERERSVPPPVATIVVNPQIVRASQAPTPYHMLRQVSGVEVHDQGQGPGFASNVVMRGFTSDHSSDVLLVVDGVPVNLPAHGHIEGYADWNVLMPESVSSLRVIHGGASPLYGDFALAGVVEVFTRADADGLEASLGTSSFGDLDGSVLTGRRGETGGFLVAGQAQSSQGWRDNQDYRLANALLRGWKALGEGRLEGGLGLYGTSWNSPGFLNVPAFNTASLTGAVDPSDGGTSRRAVVHGRYSQTLGGSKLLQATAYAQVSDYELFLHVPGHTQSTFGEPVNQSGEWDDRVSAGGQVELGWTGERGDLVFGVSGRGDNVTYQRAATLQRDVVDVESNLDGAYRTAALYARWRHTLAGRLGIDVGGRVDRLEHRSMPLRLLTAQEESSVRTLFSPKFGARFAWTPQVALKASTSKGFRSPVGIIGDPARKPYVAWSHEIGADFRSARLDLSAALFRVDVSNERLQDPVTLAVSEAGSSTRQGIELLAGVHPLDELRVQGSLTLNDATLDGMYIDAHDHGATDPAQVAGSPVAGASADASSRVPGVSRYLASARIEAPLSDLPTWVSWRVVGPHVAIAEGGVETRAYSVVDLGLTWEWTPGWAVDVELQNVADIRYVELRSSGWVTPGAPRSARVQVRMADLFQ